MSCSIICAPKGALAMSKVKEANEAATRENCDEFEFGGSRSSSNSILVLEWVRQESR